jgi:CRISPR-associated protein Cas2
LSGAAPRERHGKSRRATDRFGNEPLSKRLLYLVCYDVRCPRRLARVLKVVKAWSTGGQKSVHECWLGPAELARLERELTAEIDRSEDSLLILRPDLGAGVRTLGIAQKPRDPRFLYVG